MLLILNFDVGKKLSSKERLCPVLQINCPISRLKHCQSLRVTKIVQQIKFKGVWDELESKKLSLETISCKIFETNSSFHVK